MIVTVKNDLVFENVSLEFIRWVKQNLILANPEYAKKARMGFWLGKTPRELYLYQTDGEKYILPYGCLKLIPKEILQECYVLENHHPATKVDMGSTDDMGLYDYQELAVTKMIEGKNGILQSPTGSGKTQIAIGVIKALGLKALWLTHTHDLLNQSYDRAKLYIDESLLGKITEGKVNIGKGMTVATIQTMAKLDLERYRDIWDVVIVDECHKAVGTPTALTQFYKVLSNLDAKYKFGLSATVHRADGLIKATFALLGKVIYEIPEKMVADKRMQVGIKTIATGVPISDACLETDGTLNYTKLIDYLTKSVRRNILIAESIIENKDHSCLILSDRLEHLKLLMSILPSDMEEKAVMISGKMTTKKGKAEREKAIEDMREGKKKYLFATYSLCKEGLDIPRLDRLFMASIQKDYAVVTQSIGRIARKATNKKDAIVYDFLDDIGYCNKAYKARLRHYKKAGCYMKGEK